MIYFNNFKFKIFIFEKKWTLVKYLQALPRHNIHLAGLIFYFNVQIN